MGESIEYKNRCLEGEIYFGADAYEGCDGRGLFECGESCENSDSHSGTGGSELHCAGLTRKELGRQGELATVRFLRRHGFEILETNWTCFAGEADIIALDGDVLCFVEVKTRTSLAAGLPSEAVDERKRSRYERIAACYLKDCDRYDIRVRFDVAALLVLSDHHAFMRYHKNAFGVC